MAALAAIAAGPSSPAARRRVRNRSRVSPPSRPVSPRLAGRAASMRWRTGSDPRPWGTSVLRSLWSSTGTSSDCTGKFAREVEPKLVEEYVEDGALRVEWRDFPYLGQESLNAAVAARAAQEQGKFWEYHELLYRTSRAASPWRSSSVWQTRRASTWRGSKRISSRTGTQRSSPRTSEGQERGISGTPTFVINGQVIAGLQPVEVYEGR